MALDVAESPVASRQAKGLRGAALKAYQTFLDQLSKSGCAALGYRLTGPDPLPRLCVKHLHGRDRVLVMITDRYAFVVLVAPHVENPDRNVYDILYEIVGVHPEAEDRRDKPPCCDVAGDPPPVDEGLIDDVVDALKSFATARRR